MKNKLLAFDTSYSSCSVALQDGNEVKVLHEVAPMQQARRILPMIDELLSSAELTLHDLDAIAYACGPGSFTGTRIASTVAQGLAFITQKPVVAVSSLAMLAEAVILEEKASSVLVAVDARMGQVYWANYQINATGSLTLQGTERVCTPDEIDIPLDQRGCGVGDGWERYADKLTERLKFKPRQILNMKLPLGKALLNLAMMKLEKGEFGEAKEAQPIYL